MPLFELPSIELSSRRPRESYKSPVVTNLSFRFQSTIPEGQATLSKSSILERTIAEETDEEDKISTSISSGIRGSNPTSTRDGGATVSIKINGHMRDVVVPNSVTAKR